MSKLTISMDKEIIMAAKQLAAADDVSVSAMFRRYVLSRLKPEKSKIRIGPITKKLSGIIPSKSDEEYRDMLTDALVEKYDL